MVTQYVGMLQYQKIPKLTEFVGAEPKTGPKQSKIAFCSFMAILGLYQLPYANSYDFKASVQADLLCWHAPVSKDTQMGKVCWMQSQKQVKNKKNCILFC